MTENTLNLFKNPTSFTDELTQMLQTGARQLLHQAIEAELSTFMTAFSNQTDEQGRPLVVRNGYLPERDIVTGIGSIPVKMPKVRSRGDEPVCFRSSMIPPYVRRSISVDVALPWLYLKGVSAGDMKPALSALLGSESKGLSDSVIHRLKTQWYDDYEQWRKRTLSKDKWVYLWVDGIYSNIRGNDKLCALVVIGANSQGQKRLLAVDDGVRESKQSWREVLLDLKARGLDDFKLAIGDGALGFWSAVSEVYPDAKRQRCWVHKTANVLNKLPKTAQPKAKAKLHDIWMAETKKLANKAFDQWLQSYQDKYPKATECLLKDRDALLQFYDFPAAHWQHIRTTNPIESTFATIRHRTKRSKGCLNRNGMLSMIYKLGIGAEKRWQRLRGSEKMGQLITGVQFRDGIEHNINQQQDAA